MRPTTEGSEGTFPKLLNFNKNACNQLEDELILIYLLILSYLHEILLELVFILYLYMYLLWHLWKSI